MSEYETCLKRYYNNLTDDFNLTHDQKIQFFLKVLPEDLQTEDMRTQIDKLLTHYREDDEKPS